MCCEAIGAVGFRSAIHSADDSKYAEQTDYQHVLRHAPILDSRLAGRDEGMIGQRVSRSPRTAVGPPVIAV
jgi:hypothetical protein